MESSTNNGSTRVSDGRPSQTKHTKSDHFLWHEVDGFETTVKLVSGSLLGGESFADVYTDIEDITGNESRGNFRSVNIDSNHSESRTKFQTKIPTLSGVARMVAREEGKTLDKKQYIMYEVLACTFLLDLINKQNVDRRSALARKMSGVLGSERCHNMDELTEILEAKGGRNQLIMFVTGLAGAGKSTGINIAQRFCYEFCKAASIMWRDNKFLFTAYTGSAAAAFGWANNVFGNFPRQTQSE